MGVDSMTGFNSKQQMAANKLQDESDMLTIAYLHGYDKGKKAALAQPEHLRDFFYTCNHCGEETLVQSGNHHPWCACGSDNFDWGNERPAHPAQEPEREALKLALEFVESVHAGEWGSATNRDELVAAIKAALAQPAQEPVAWWNDMSGVIDLNVSGRGKPLYTTPPQREWVGLTNEEIKKVLAEISQIPPIDFTTKTYAQAIEAKLKEKNT